MEHLLTNRKTGDAEGAFLQMGEVRMQVWRQGVGGCVSKCPYYIEGLHAGYVGTYDCSQITDWLIYTPQRRISPDDVYLLELEERE